MDPSWVVFLKKKKTIDDYPSSLKIYLFFGGSKISHGQKWFEVPAFVPVYISIFV